MIMENYFDASTPEFEVTPRLGLHAIHVARDLEAEKEALQAAVPVTQAHNQADLVTLMDDAAARHEAREELARIEARLRRIPAKLADAEQQAAQAAQQVGALILPSLFTVDCVQP